MEIQKILAPFDTKEMLDLIELTFGKDERELEARQLDGSESEYNSDYVYIAKEGNDILGTLHITVPKEFSKICGVSAVLTTEAARGKGVGNALFSKATEDIDSMGIELSVLGTSNPIAAKLYSKYGFGYCFGSGIMMRFKSGHLVDYNKKYLDDSAIEIKVEEGTPSARIPIVPLSIYKTNFLINAINSDNVNNFFWNKSKIKFIENRDDFFIDIDTPQDLNKFYKIIKK